MRSAFARPKPRRLTRLTWSDGGRDTLDLIKDYSAEHPILGILLRFAFRITSTSGGTVSGLSQDASVQLMAERLSIIGHHKELGSLTVLDMAAVDLAHFWHLANDLIGKEQDFSDPAPTVSSSLDGRREFLIPFDSPYFVERFASYLDPRDFTSLQLKIEYGNDADYATTNLSDVDLATIDVLLVELQHGLAVGRPHFVPKYVAHQFAIGANTSADLRGQGILTGGYIPLMQVTPHDDSATGNSERDVAGLIRRLSLEHGDELLVDKVEWNQMAEDTERHFPKSFTTTRRIGPATILFDQRHNISALVDNRSKSITPIIDTLSAVQQGTTGITAAAGDRADFILLALLPTSKMRGILEAAGAA